MRARRGMIGALATAWLAAAAPADAVFPGDEGRIAFTRPERIFVMDADGTDLELLRGEASDPEWSADGTRLAFAGRRGSGKTDVFVMNADGSGVEPLTRFRPGFNGSPSWSPDATRVVFVHTGPEGTDLYTVDTDGSPPVRLTTSPRIEERAPEWSPDGTRILYSRSRPTSGTDEDLFVVDADGSDVTRIGPTDFDDFQGSWSPDGTHVVFARETPRLRVKVFVMEADGSNPVRLSAGPTSEFWPTFSPDGARIALSRCVDFACDLYVMNVDGTGAQALTSTPKLESHPSWQAA